MTIDNTLGRYEIDTRRIHRVLGAELDTFMNRFGEQPVGELQDLRAFLIAWTAVFMPEAIPAWFRKRLEETMLGIRAREDFGTYGWYSTVALDVALYALSAGAWPWLNVARNNCNHHSRALRAYVLESMALVADRLSFDDAYLCEQLERNFASVHFDCEWGAVLLAVSRGKADAKRALFEEWANQHRMNPHQEEALRNLAAGRPIPNPFVSHLLWVQQYVAMRFACMTDRDAEQLTLLGEMSPESEHSEPATEQSPLFAEDTPASLPERLFRRLREHPLSAPYVSVKDA